MQRTKWMRLAMRDLGDVIRWAGAQQAREIGEFRYRVINGREIVSFRLVPNYAIEIGAREIVVVAHVRGSGWRARLRELRRLGRVLLYPLPPPSSAASRLARAAAHLPPHRIGQ